MKDLVTCCIVHLSEIHLCFNIRGHGRHLTQTHLVQTHCCWVEVLKNMEALICVLASSLLLCVQQRYLSYKSLTNQKERLYWCWQSMTCLKGEPGFEVDVSLKTCARRTSVLQHRYMIYWPNILHIVCFWRWGHVQGSPTHARYCTVHTISWCGTFDMHGIRDWSNVAIKYVTGRRVQI